jgi:hypothetical protein
VRPGSDASEKDEAKAKGGGGGSRDGKGGKTTPRASVIIYVARQKQADQVWLALVC